jgi:Asp-tRNA(Asn)/Glu-tRNA(Gln) amidotransferase A subunit family amidase
VTTPGAVRATAGAIASGRATAVDAVEECVRRIRERDPALGSVVALRVDEALEEAAELDARRASGGAAGPLHGVPVLVKDLEDVGGMPTRKGSRLRVDAPPAVADEVVPALLRRAGAVVVGKTNLPEFATEGFTDNLLDGTTRNPWDLAQTPGGSSGGSGAALAAGLVPIATATDGGGSVRIPSAVCGLVGLKPTHGAVGRWPAADWLDLSTYGPMATTVDDLRLLLSLMTGVVAGDPDSGPFPTSSGPLPTRVVVAERTSPLGPLPAAVADAFHAAADAMAELLGAERVVLDHHELFADLGDPDLDWFLLAPAEHVSALGRDLVEQNLDAMHPATAEFMRHGLGIGIDDYLAARRRRTLYTRRLDELLGDDAVLLTPTVAVDTWFADGRTEPDGAVGMTPPSAFSTAVQNMTGHPAVSLPAGRHASGLPFGLQVTGARWSDTSLLDVASLWEQARPWPRTAPGYDEFRVG